MTQVVSPSAINSITAKQIGNVCDLLTAALRKSGLQSEAVQLVFKQQGDLLITETIATIRKRVEAVSTVIVRQAKVDRTRTPRKVVDATDRQAEYIDRDVLATMPQGEGDEVDVYFLPIKCDMPTNEIPALLAQSGLVSDPRAQAAVNEDNHAFADKYPNVSQWGDNCCRLVFDWWNERRVFCGRSSYLCRDVLWIAGVPASRK
jgi:hypothetical protein